MKNAPLYALALLVLIGSNVITFYATTTSRLKAENAYLSERIAALSKQLGIMDQTVHTIGEFEVPPAPMVEGGYIPLVDEETTESNKKDRE